jgi:LysR family transcriptional regulator, transcriptional activator for dmlA
MMVTPRGAVQPADLAFFSTLASTGSLSAAARELGISTPAVSKHLAQMESRLNVPLVVRTTRRMSLTPEGELYLQHARRILGDMDGMAAALGAAHAKPQGLLRVNATLGFGRRHVAPAISRFAMAHPEVQVQLQLSVNPPPVSDDAFDVCIRHGPPPDSRVVAKLLAPNRRLIVAAPAYLAAHGIPKVPQDLTRHDCIGIRQGDEAYGLWRFASLTRGQTAIKTTTKGEAIKTRGTLTTNDGEIAVQWALDGHGVLMRAQWDIAHHLQSGRLVEVLATYRTPDADIYAVMPQRLQHTPRVQTFVAHLQAALRVKSTRGASG